MSELRYLGDQGRKGDRAWMEDRAELDRLRLARLVVRYSHLQEEHRCKCDRDKLVVCCIYGGKCLIENVNNLAIHLRCLRKLRDLMKISKHLIAASFAWNANSLWSGGN